MKKEVNEEDKFIKKNRKGISGVIAIILLVLLVLVAVLIIWNVVKSMVKTSSEKISIEQFKVNLEIESAYISEDNSTAYVSINRKAGKGEIKELKFIFTDSSGNSYIYSYNISEGIPNELETKIYRINASFVKLQNPGFNNFSNIISVGIAFGIKTESGESLTSNIKDEFKNNLREDEGLILKVNAPEEICINECVYSDWVSVGCGLGGCPSNQIYRSRTVISGTGCTLTSGCADDSFCNLMSQAVSYWKFEDNLDDEKGRNKLLFNGALPLYTEGKSSKGKSLSLNGVNEFAYNGTIDLNLAPGSFSIAVWIKPKQVTGIYRTIIEYDRWGRSWMGIWVNVANFHFRVGSQVMNSIKTLEADKWYFLTATYNSTSKNMSVYIDGDYDSSQNFSSISYYSAPSKTNLTIGGPQYFNNGSIDDLMIFNKVLSQSEIKDLYGSGLVSLSRDNYYDKVHGMWLGKIIGHHLVRKYEAVWIAQPCYDSYRLAGYPDTIVCPGGITIYYIPPGYINRISGNCSPTDYDECYVNSKTDDDANIDRMNLYIFETYGLNPTNENIKQAWVQKFSGLYFANRMALNLMSGTIVPMVEPCIGDIYNCTPSGYTCPVGGCVPPYSGMYGYNAYHDYIDAQMSSETIAGISPGMSIIARNYADQFARISNDDYAVDYTKFYAMMNSKAFFEDNVTKIINNVKNEFPSTSRVHGIVDNITFWRSQYPDWNNTRKKIYDEYYLKEILLYANGRSNFCIHSTVNFASTIMGVLYSDNLNKSLQFDKGVQITALSGWDTEDNAAAAASFLGIIAGEDNIPNKWKAPVRDRVESIPSNLFDQFETLTNLANRTVNLGEQVIVANGGIKSSDGNEFFIKRS